MSPSSKIKFPSHKSKRRMPSNKVLHPGEILHRKLEQRYWRLSLYLSFIATFATIVGGALAFYAYLETRRQANAAAEQTLIAKQNLVESNRPWLELRNVKIHKMDVGPVYVDISFGLDIINVGHAPAQNVSIDAKVMDVGPLPDVLLPELREFCERATYLRNRTGLRGFLIGNPIDVIFPDASVVQHRNGWAGASINSSGFIGLIGCVTYITTTDGASMSTRQVFRLSP